jgi:hypothetical protein
VPDEWNQISKRNGSCSGNVSVGETWKCERQDDGIRRIYIDSVSLIYCKAYKCDRSTIDHRSPTIDQTCIDWRQR